MDTTLVARMREIVDNCLGDEVAYCQAACPMHTDVKRYIGLIAAGDERRALEVIREQLFLPATLGRICAHPCEAACKRNELHSAMSIAALKRYVADAHDDSSLWDTSTAPPRSESVGVIGAGPAGGQAAIDLARAGVHVTIYERLPVVGGMLRVGIPSYRLPREIIDFEYRYLRELGVTIQTGVEVGRDVTIEQLRERHDAVVIAVGAHRGVVIPVPGHDLEGVYNAVDFLREVSLTGRFSSPLGNQLVVIGGGNVALDTVRSARRLGVDDVHLVMLEGDKREAPAHDWEIDEALEEGIHVHYRWGTHAIGGSRRVECIELKRCLSLFDEEGRFQPSYDEGVRETLPVSSVIFAVGQATDNGCAPLLETTFGGRFVVDETTLQTVDKRVVVAGDASGHATIAVEAMAEGRKAATTLLRLFDHHDLLADRERERAYTSRLETEIPADAPCRERVVSRRRTPDERVLDFDEYDLGLTRDQAKHEAEGCLQCECLKCMQECEMLGDFTECPKYLFEEILAAEEIAPVVPYSCNMCRQCTLACPKEFDMQGIFGQMRTELVSENGGKSPMKGHGAIDMHQMLSFSKPFNTTVAAPEGVTKRVFIPGCALSNHSPDGVGQIFDHLQERLGYTGAILKCCGKPTKAIGQYQLFQERYAALQGEIDRLGADEIIVACQSCFLNMSTYSPKQRVRSLWEVLPEIGLPEGAVGKALGSDIVFAIHDSCSTRDRRGIHDGVRWIMRALGYATEEPPHTRETARCCGFGGMVVPANPELATRVMNRRTAEVKSDYMVTYCAACRESMVKGGKHAAHLLDLIFEGAKIGPDDFVGVPSTPLKPWLNRYRAKKALEAAGERHDKAWRSAKVHA